MPDTFDYRKDTSDPFWSFLKGVRAQAVDEEIGVHCGASVLSSASGGWVQVSPDRIRAALAQAAAAGRAFERSRSREETASRGWLSRQTVRFRTPILVAGIMLGVLLSAFSFQGARSGRARGGSWSSGADIDPMLLALGIGILIASVIIYRRGHR